MTLDSAVIPGVLGSVWVVATMVTTKGVSVGACGVT